ncbi:zinc finger protein 511 [Periophthalmus magnuspinnatus]|uniref:zinc finger protein 511 n=1 Tax=Periophthalmus magnuspinnatus TaxID=409849 RepID=UPI00145A1079|nr:zinc finger protein 511 [Periophthalmus magnuspinnatus]XP_055083284.1 zinc finger protein 511 [Periophthalmus magnuspinnatus]
MLQPHLAHLMTEENVLVKSSVDNCPTSSETEGKDENPFNFQPQVIHLPKDHELFEDGDVQRHMYLQNLYISAADEEPALRVSEFACHISGCTATFKTLQEYEHHYNSLHRHVCCTCRRSLPTARLLDIHIQEWHDSLFAVLAQKQDMYQCLVEGCGLKFRTIKDRKDHLIIIHKYPPDFRFDKIRRDNRDKRRALPSDTEMEVVTDVCESEGMCEVVCGTTSNQRDPDPSDMNVSEENTGHMETSASTAPDPTEPTKPRYSYRVPPNVCFGQGSVRGFRGQRGKRK